MNGEIKPLKSCRFFLPSLAAVLGFFIAILILSTSKGFPFGPWVPIWDDAGWLSIVRLWCQGGSLYKDLLDQKPPGFFLYLRPFCWVPQNPNLLVSKELYVFWCPIFFLFSVSLYIFTVSWKPSKIHALFFGLFVGALLWNNRLGQFFSTEYPALAFTVLALSIAYSSAQHLRCWGSLYVALSITLATLCNVKFISFFFIYFYAAKNFRKVCLRDLLSSLLLAVLVIMLATDFSLTGVKSLLQLSDVLNYHPISLMKRLQNLGDILTRTNLGLMALVKPTATFFGVPSQVTHYGWYGKTLLVSSVVFLGIYFPIVALSLIGSIVTIIIVGTTWDHTLIQFYPFLIFLGLIAFSTKNKMGFLLKPMLVLMTALSLFNDMKDQTHYFRMTRVPSRIGEAEKLSKIFFNQLSHHRWVSLLGNSYAYWSIPGILKPENRLFHNYCFNLPDWAEGEVREKLKGNVRVALHSQLGDPSCKTSGIIGEVRNRCILLGYARDRIQGKIEFRDCKDSQLIALKLDGLERLAVRKHERFLR